MPLGYNYKKGIPAVLVRDGRIFGTVTLAVGHSAGRPARYTYRLYIDLPADIDVYRADQLPKDVLTLEGVRDEPAVAIEDLGGSPAGTGDAVPGETGPVETGNGEG